MSAVREQVVMRFKYRQLTNLIMIAIVALVCYFGWHLTGIALFLAVLFIMPIVMFLTMGVILDFLQKYLGRPVPMFQTLGISPRHK